MCITLVAEAGKLGKAPSQSRAVYRLHSHIVTLMALTS